MNKSKRCDHCGKKLLTNKAWIEVHAADPAMPSGAYCNFGICYAAAREALNGRKQQDRVVSQYDEFLGGLPEGRPTV